MYRVTKEIKFCFGHRLLEYPGKCRNLHGHNARALVTIATDRLDGIGMATEFADIKRSVGEWVDAHLDHRTVLHQDDPLAARWRRSASRRFCSKSIQRPRTWRNCFRAGQAPGCRSLRSGGCVGERFELRT